MNGRRETTEQPCYGEGGIWAGSGEWVRCAPGDEKRENRDHSRKDKWCEPRENKLHSEHYKEPHQTDFFVGTEVNTTGIVTSSWNAWECKCQSESFNFSNYCLASFQFFVNHIIILLEPVVKQTLLRDWKKWYCEWGKEFDHVCLLCICDPIYL